MSVRRLKWSEFKKLVESKLGVNDPEIGFILFDTDYEPDKLYVFLSKNGKELAVEG